MTGTTKHTSATLLAPVMVSSWKERDDQMAATPAVPAAMHRALDIRDEMGRWQLQEHRAWEEVRIGGETCAATGMVPVCCQIAGK